MKRVSLRLTLVVVLASLSSFEPAVGQFVKIDDFESYPVGDLDGQGYWAADTGIEVAVEPGTTNHVFNALGGAFDAVAFNDDPNLEIADGEIATLFTRFQRGFNNHIIWGLSDVDVPNVWGDFEAGIGVRWQDGRNEGPLDVRTGGSYNELADIPEDEWFNIWMVIDNDNDELQVYAQSENTFPEQTMLDDGTSSTFYFRNGTDDPLVTFFLRLGADYHYDQAYLDDIYMDPQGENLDLPTFQGGPRLQAGDADQDLDFDQLDLVKVQVAAKYLHGESATWGEGDWDGAPGGEPGNPPQGNGVFDQLDIIAALAPGHYLTGPYAAISPGGAEDDDQTSILYNPDTGELGVNAPASGELTSINIDSAAGVFTGAPAQNLGGSFDNDADDNIFKATFGGSFGSLSFGTVAQAGLSEQFVLGDLTVVGSRAGGGDLGVVDLIYVPEPSTLWLGWLGLGLLAACFPKKGVRSLFQKET